MGRHHRVRDVDAAVGDVGDVAYIGAHRGACVSIAGEARVTSNITSRRPMADRPPTGHRPPAGTPPEIVMWYGQGRVSAEVKTRVRYVADGTESYVQYENPPERKRKNVTPLSRYILFLKGMGGEGREGERTSVRHNQRRNNKLIHSALPLPYAISLSGFALLVHECTRISALAPVHLLFPPASVNLTFIPTVGFISLPNTWQKKIEKVESLYES